MEYRLDELAERTGAKLVGDPGTLIKGIGSLTGAVPGQLTFLSHRRYREHLKKTRASAAVVHHDDSGECALPMLVCNNPYLAFARLSQVFWQPPRAEPGVHATAVVADGSRLGKGASVGPGAVVGTGTVVGDDCVIGPNCVLGEDCTLGKRCRLEAGAVLGRGVSLGDDVLIYSGAVIGADGFGFADDEGAWVKIMQRGGVVIGNGAEIGANTTIDRGALDDTVIGEGVKIDNQVQIAHNVRVGAHTAIAGCAGVGGSTVIGRHCRIGGGVGIADHVTICDHVTVGGMSCVTASIREAGVYASCVPLSPYRNWLRNMATLKQLAPLAKRVQRLERKAGGQ